MSRILYIFILITAICFYPLYRDNLSYIILISVTALPVLMAVQLAVSAKLLTHSIKKNSSAIFKGNEGEAQITLVNNSFFPMSGVRVGVRITYLPTGETRRQTADIPLPARSSQTVTVGITPKNCGEARVFLEYVKVYDLLHLFSVKLFKNEGMIGRVCIIPKVEAKYSEEAAALMQERSAASGNDEGSKGDSGAFGDVSGYRDFIPGDRLSRLHHKLSARFDKDIVRVMSPDSSGHFLLTADLSAGFGANFGNADHSNADNIGNTPDKRDKRLEKLISMAYYLVQEGAQVCIAVPENTSAVSMMIGSTPAFHCANGADCLAAAKVLCGADFAGIYPVDRANRANSSDNAQGSSTEYITVHIEDNDEEII
ncbi:MAG: DUF58 domain-containing protein [Oscillospiraceae bacterium]|nr:DUF58 domain-containing protein [Oscillospiraceae bacterium]